MTSQTRRPISTYESLLRRKREEGLTYTELSKESGIPACTLQYWAKKLNRPQPSPPHESATGAFVQLNTDDPSDAPLELVLEPNVRITIRPGFDPRTLRAIVDALTC
jgi:hypothetical protein